MPNTALTALPRTGRTELALESSSLQLFLPNTDLRTPWWQWCRLAVKRDCLLNGNPTVNQPSAFNELYTRLPFLGAATHHPFSDILGA